MARVGGMVEHQNPVTREEVRDLCRRLGFEPERVSRLTFGYGLVTVEHVIPLAGDDPE